MHNITDARYIAIKRGLNQLTARQLRKIVGYNRQRKVVYDTFNYDPRSKLWCPLAIGIDLHDRFQKESDGGFMTDERAKQLIVQIGSEMNGIEFSINPLKGIEGDFFRLNRPQDLEQVCNDLINEKETSKKHILN